MTQKVLLVIVAVVVVGGAALFMMRGSQSEGDSQAVAPSAQNSEQQAIAPTPTPNPATATATGGSSGAVVDEFSAAMDAELNASASAIAELDAGDSASVSDIQAAGSNSNLYDPNSI